MTDSVRLELSADVALVLFELLSRYGESDTLTLVDQAEQRALWNFLGSLEAKLVQPFSSDYAQLLSAARGRLREVVV